MEVGSVAQLLSVKQAIAILDAVEVKPRVIQLPLMEAMDLRLAEDIYADRDYPPFDKAVMDGFAVRSADTAEPGARLAVVETIAAGQISNRQLEAGQATKIMTGAPLPAGADAVVPVEQTKVEGDRVVLDRSIRVGNAVAKRGSDTLANRLLLKTGTPLGPAQIGVAACVGKAVVSVYAAPTVALLTTGDEIIDMDQSPTGAQIRNSNAPMMTALLRQLGCDVRDLGIVRDDPHAIRAAIEDGLQSDALFITGGMSMGERDYVPMLLRDLGMELKISKLRIKPGKPFAFATDQESRKMAFGLPGNPVSAYVCTVRLAARVLIRLAGGFPNTKVSYAKVGVDLPANGPREFYMPGICEGEIVTPLTPNGSADLFTLAQANCLIVRPEDGQAVMANEKVGLIFLE